MLGARRFLPLELYLRYPGKYKPDAEYVDGRIVRRTPADWLHSSWQGAILHFLFVRGKSSGLLALPSLRIRVAPSRVRVPDVVLLGREQPVEQVPTYPPLGVFEILSREDCMTNMLEKFADLAAMGVPEIWLAEPEVKEFSRYTDGKLVKQTHYGKPGDRIHFELKAIGDYLN